MSEAYLDVSMEFCKNPLSKPAQERYQEAGLRIADLWLGIKHKYIDLWGFDWFGEEFVEAFLKRILEKSNNPKADFDEVYQIQWYYGCQTAAMLATFLGVEYVPIDVQHKQWTEQFIKDNFGK